MRERSERNPWKSFISAQRATETCRDAIRANQRVEQFKDEFLVPLHEWCEGRTDKVRACDIPRSMHARYQSRADFFNQFQRDDIANVLVGRDLAAVEHHVEQLDVPTVA